MDTQIEYFAEGIAKSHDDNENTKFYSYYSGTIYYDVTSFNGPPTKYRWRTANDNVEFKRTWKIWETRITDTQGNVSNRIEENHPTMKDKNNTWYPSEDSYYSLIYTPPNPTTKVSIWVKNVTGNTLYFQISEIEFYDDEDNLLKVVSSGKELSNFDGTTSEISDINITGIRGIDKSYDDDQDTKFYSNQLGTIYYDVEGVPVKYRWKSADDNESYGGTWSNWQIYSTDADGNQTDTIDESHPTIQDQNYTWYPSDTTYYSLELQPEPEPEPEPEPRIQCLSQVTNNIVSMENPYIFNDVNYADYDLIGLYNGRYTLTGITDVHPIGFVIDDISLFEVSGTPFETPKIIDGVSVQHYIGTIIIDVKGDFGTISYNCYNHGYMGGQNRLTYSSTCPNIPNGSYPPHILLITLPDGVYPPNILAPEPEPNQNRNQNPNQNQNRNQNLHWNLNVYIPMHNQYMIRVE